MKLSVVAVAALAASVSAAPFRMITLPIDGSNPFESVPAAELSSNLIHSGEQDNAEMRILSQPLNRKPCHKAKSSFLPGPIGGLLSRFGIGSRPQWKHLDSAVKVVPVEGWRHEIEELIEAAEKKIVPLMEGGAVIYHTTLLPEKDASKEEHVHKHYNHHHDAVEGEEREWKHRHHHHVHAEEQEEHKHRHHHHELAEGEEHEHRHHHHRGKFLRPHGGHHWRQKAHSFSGRLHRALLHLSPPEAITMAFVLGAGIGSILHLFFMLFLLGIRRLRGDRTTCYERRAFRRARREARRAAKAGKTGAIKLEEDEEVLPSYAEGEADRLVEKA